MRHFFGRIQQHLFANQLGYLLALRQIRNFVGGKEPRPFRQALHNLVQQRRQSVGGFSRNSYLLIPRPQLAILLQKHIRLARHIDLV